MAKKDKQPKKDKSGGTAADTVDAIRSTIERTLEGAGLTEKRQREVVEQVSAAAGRIRQTLDDLKVVDEVRDMRTQLETLAARVAELEAGARSRVTGAARAAGARATNSGGTATRARSTGTRSTSTRSTTAAASRTKPKSAGTRSTGAAKQSSAAGARSKPAKTATRTNPTGAKSTSTTPPRTSRTRSKPSS
jgi:hypothetical protein